VTGIHAGRRAGKEAAFALRHLRPGMRLLDLGCGPGTITAGLGEAVTPGMVVGLDLEASVLDQARALVVRQHVPVSFVLGSAVAVPCSDGCFDAVFAHTLLEHVAEPASVLAEARRVLKPGGLLAVRDCDWSSGIFAPPEPAITRAMALYERVWRHNGGHPDCGRQLRGLLHAAGFAGVETSVSFRWDGTQDGSPNDSRSFGELLARRLALANFAGPIHALGLADAAELEQIAAACAAWSRHPDAFAAMMMVEAVGWAA
jgi:SAM-dependent methyltransferase